MLTTHEAVELNVAFPYSRGRYQLPLGETVLVNDLYGTPMYQLVERDLKPGHPLPQLSRPQGWTPSSSLTEPSGSPRSQGL